MGYRITEGTRISMFLIGKKVNDILQCMNEYYCTLIKDIACYGRWTRKDEKVYRELCFISRWFKT